MRRVSAIPFIFTIPHFGRVDLSAAPLHPRIKWLQPRGFNFQKSVATFSGEGATAFIGQSVEPINQSINHVSSVF